MLFFLALPPEGAGDIWHPIIDVIRAVFWWQPIALQL